MRWSRSRRSSPRRPSVVSLGACLMYVRHTSRLPFGVAPRKFWNSLLACCIIFFTFIFTVFEFSKLLVNHFNFTQIIWHPFISNTHKVKERLQQIPGTGLCPEECMQEPSNTQAFTVPLSSSSFSCCGWTGLIIWYARHLTVTRYTYGQMSLLSMHLHIWVYCSLTAKMSAFIEVVSLADNQLINCT